MNRQGQSAADGAVQAQGGRDAVVTIHQGLTLEEATQVMEAVVAKSILEYQSVARHEAAVNASAFAKAVVHELVEIDRLDMLSDPAYLHLLDKAHLKAATTAEPRDHEMLARLLSDRAQRTDRPTWAAIDRAVEVIPLLDSSALSALTVIDAAFTWASPNPAAGAGLALLDKIYAELISEDLPTGSDWLDHLYSQDCIRMTGVNDGSGFIPWIDWFSMTHTGYACIGVEMHQIEDLKKRFTLPPLVCPDVFVPHDVLPGRFRALFSHHERVTEQLVDIGGNETAARYLHGLMSQEAALSAASAEGKAALGKMIEDLPHLERLRAFWDSIPESFRLTQIGRVIARANARHLDKSGFLPHDELEPAGTKAR